ncbi:MAG: radical SAM protein [Desulfobacteraceae bacterium]|nr:radical SAM protein [Desulfobacteraceae bacterium]
MTPFIPRYVRASQTGALTEKIRQAEALLSPCILCPRQCRVDRDRDEKGYCGAGKKAVVASFAPHFGEEPPLVGDRGSGTVFFSHCNLKCLFCQNYEISIEGRGQAMEAEEIASVMIYLQNMGCCNINLVTPSHVVPQILKALEIAAGLGLRLPLVYNSSGYDSVETLKILKDVVDIYMPDFKFWEAEAADRYCQAKDYPDIARNAVLEMQAQVGDLLLDEDGLALSGLLVRHLVMPGRISDTGRILNFLKEKVSPHTHVNLMSQYRPMGEAKTFKELSLPLSPEDFRSALKLGRASGLVLVR